MPVCPEALRLLGGLLLLHAHLLRVRGLVVAGVGFSDDRAVEVGLGDLLLRPVVAGRVGAAPSRRSRTFESSSDFSRRWIWIGGSARRHSLAAMSSWPLSVTLRPFSTLPLLASIVRVPSAFTGGEVSGSAGGGVGSDAGSAPVPVSDTTSGISEALVVNWSVAALAPADVGAKTTSTVQVWEGGRGLGSGVQVLEPQLELSCVPALQRETGNRDRRRAIAGGGEGLCRGLGSDQHRPKVF